MFVFLIQTFESDDNCSACLGKGELLCCDSCPRVFHFACVQEGFEEANPPNGSWLCNVCKSSDTSHIPGEGLFGQILNTLDALNPRAFQLDRSLRESFEHVFTHPVTGAFMDMRHVKITGSKPKQKTIKTKQKPSLTTKHLPPSPSTSPASLEQIDELEKSCYQCGKTAMSVSPTSFLFSNTFESPRLDSLQLQRSKLIKCDYCPLFWHLDCHSPPLASVPNELLSEEEEHIDLGEYALVRSHLWSKTCLDEPLFTNQQVPIPETVLSCQDMYEIEKADVGSPVLATYRYLNIRRKWMCPCHADWNTPALSFRTDYTNERPVRWMGTHEDLIKDSAAHLDKKKKKRISKMIEKGHIEIENSPETHDFFTATKTVVPERKVQIDFLKRTVSMSSECYEKFKEFDISYYSKIQNVPMATNWEPHNAAVEAMVEGNTQPDVR